MDLESLAVDAVVKSLEGYVERAMAGVDARVAALLEAAEKRFEERLQSLPVPVNGKDAEPVDYGVIASTIDEKLAAAVAQIPAVAGPIGPAGPAGKDADPIDYDAIVSTIDKKVLAAVAEIPRVQGDPGPAGKDAEPVDVDALCALIVADANATLRDDLDAKVAEAFKAMPTPRDGEDGIDGQPGQDGKDGAPGEPGRDGAQVDVLPDIIPEKAYARGTWAAHAGSLWRASRMTSPLEGCASEFDAGWNCIVNGIGEIAVTLDTDKRCLAFDIKTGSGRHVTKATVPLIIDRGVFERGREYAAGDVVGHDGSGWIAQQGTSDEPGTSKSWRLIAKRGRDGRDTTAPKLPSGEPVRLR